MMGVQVAWTCVGYIVVGVFDKGLHLGRVQERQSKIQWNIRHHKTVGAFLWWDIFDEFWWYVVWTNLNESETWWSATDSMISFCTCPLTFSGGAFQGGRKGTHTTRYYEHINNTLRTAMALKTILDQDAKGIKNIQKHVHAFLVWWFSQATLWAKCQWFNVGNCGQWETTHGSGHRVNWCYFLFTKVVYGVQNRKTRRKFYFFVVSKSSQFRWENTLVSISGGSGIRPSCSSCLIKPKSNGYKRNVVNTSIELHLFEVINSYYFLCNLFSSFVCICRFGGSCNQKVRYGKIQKQQDSCKFEWQVLLLAVLFTTGALSMMIKEVIAKRTMWTPSRSQKSSV